MSYALLFANGVLSLVGVLALIWHMNEHWAALGRQRNQVWCMCLFGYSVLVAAASIENLTEGAPLELHHFGSTIMSISLIAAVIWSLRQYKRGSKERNDNGR